MSARLTDVDIAALIAERKPAPSDLQQQLVTKLKRGHKESVATIKGSGGSDFAVIVRESIFNALDFSVILGVELPKSGQIFRLRRYNGRHHHTNAIEGVSFYGFHIHSATERYQAMGRDEDAFAEPTTRYSTLSSAVDCLIIDCAFELPPDPQGRLPFRSM